MGNLGMFKYTLIPASNKIQKRLGSFINPFHPSVLVRQLQYNAAYQETGHYAVIIINPCNIPEIYRAAYKHAETSNYCNEYQCQHFFILSSTIINAKKIPTD
jgi:hypothetical protein